VVVEKVGLKKIVGGTKKEKLISFDAKFSLFLSPNRSTKMAARLLQPLTWPIIIFESIYVSN